MIELKCIGGPLHGHSVVVYTPDDYLTVGENAKPTRKKPPFGSGYYAPQNREIDGRVERVLRWEGEL